MACEIGACRAPGNRRPRVSLSCMVWQSQAIEIGFELIAWRSQVRILCRYRSSTPSPASRKQTFPCRRNTPRSASRSLAPSSRAFVVVSLVTRLSWQDHPAPGARSVESRSLVDCNHHSPDGHNNAGIICQADAQGMGIGLMRPLTSTGTQSGPPAQFRPRTQDAAQSIRQLAQGIDAVTPEIH